MNRRVGVILLLLLAASTLSAADLQGIVRANEINGSPLPGVPLKAAGANPTASFADGTFSLKFPEKQEGESVVVEVLRKGYAVVNAVQLKTVLPKPAEEKLTIILCKEGDREEMARRFYRLKSIEAIEQHYRNLHREQDQTNTEAIAALRKERDRALAAAEKIAEELARLKPGTTSELYDQAMSLFLSGKPEEALEILDENKLHLSIEAARKRKEEADKEIEQSIQAYVFKAQIQTTRLRFDEAERIYRAALAEAPDDLEVNYNFGKFSLTLNRHDDAKEAYVHALNLARRSGNKARESAIQNNLGILYANLNQLDHAAAAHAEAVKILRELAAKDADTYLPQLSVALMNSGHIHTQRNEVANARQVYEEARKISMEAAAKNAANFQYVATVLGSIAVFEFEHGGLGAARTAVENALKLHRDLPKADAETNAGEFAQILQLLANIHSAQDRPEAARKAYEEAVATLRRLQKQNPEQYEPVLAAALSNMGVFLAQQNLGQQADAALTEALGIYGTLMYEQPDAYSAEAAAVLLNLIVVFDSTGRPERALKAADEAIKIYQQLVEQEPESYLPDLAKALSNRASVLVESDPAKALIDLEKALGIFSKLAEGEPSTFLPYKATVLANLGSIDPNQASGRARMESAVVLYRQLATEEPDAHLPSLAEALAMLGLLHQNQSRIPEARAAFEEALGLYAKLVEKNPQRYGGLIEQIKTMVASLGR